MTSQDMTVPSFNHKFKNNNSSGNIIKNLHPYTLTSILFKIHRYQTLLKTAEICENCQLYHE